MDLTTRYLGLKLKNPIVPSASPLSYTLDGMKQLEDAGASAIVMYSIFEEQIAHETSELLHYLSQGTESYSEALSYFPDVQQYNTGPDEYLELIKKAKEDLGIPIIGSLNGVSVGGWTNYAKKIQEAGADALELNVYYIPTDPNTLGPDIERQYIELLKSIKQSIRIPVAVKLSPYFSAMSNMAKNLANAGADGLVLFNRFYQPDIDLTTLEINPCVNLSTSQEMRLPLRWIAILFGHVKASLAATSGIHDAEDVIKMLMVGADVTMMCSALLKHGPDHIKKVLSDMEEWMTENDYKSISQMKGSLSQKSVADPTAFERANYMKSLYSYK
jgi:dihydroorotate dehydrogenase (fumarate)